MAFNERAWEPKPVSEEQPPRAEEMFGAPEMSEVEPAVETTKRTVESFIGNKPEATKPEPTTSDALANQPAEVAEQVHTLQVIEAGLQQALKEADLAHLPITDQMLKAALDGRVYEAHSPDGMIITIAPDEAKRFAFTAVTRPDPDIDKI